MRSNYAKAEFWEDRYQKVRGYYDWLQPYMGVGEQQGLRDWFIDNVDVESKLLIVGCGVSRMPTEMFEDGYDSLVMIDRSYWAIKFQMENNKYPQDLAYHCMDVRDMSQFKDGQFDYVIDKALLDSIICGPDPVKVSEQMLTEIHRVLKPHGAYICISHGAEIHRKKYLKNVKLYQWKYKKHILMKINPKGPPTKAVRPPAADDKKNYHFVYVARKQTEEVFDSEDEEIKNMFIPKFYYEGEKPDNMDEMIPIKEEVLKEDPNDEKHPTTKSNALDPQHLNGPVQKLAEQNWAWKFKYFDPQLAKEQYQQFTDIQCISIEYIYQKWIMAKKLGYAVHRTVKGEYYHQPEKYEIFPIDAVHTMDLRHQIMYENKNPKNYYRVYRSMYNQRYKPTWNILAEEQQSARNRQRPESAVSSLLDERKAQKFKDPDPSGFFKQPYRPKSGATTREDMRNQYGKMFLKKNGYKYPSINQLVNGLILTNLDILKEQNINYHNYHLDQAYCQYKAAFDKLLNLLELGDPDKPIDQNTLRFDHNHPIVQTIMYFYSLEPPFYKYLNKACREKDPAQLDKLGPFACTLGEIVRNQDAFREDRQPTDFKVYRGLTLPDEEVLGLKYIIQDIRKAKDSFATGDNLNFRELLIKEQAPVAAEIRELSQFFIDNYHKDIDRFFKKFVDAVGMAAVTNKDVEENMTALFSGIVTALQDYNEHKTKEVYDVSFMKQKYEKWTMKEFKKWPGGGETQLYANLVEFMANFNIIEYYRLIKEPIMEDLMFYLQKVHEIPIEEQTGDKGRNSLLWKMIPLFKKIMEFLCMNEQTVREQLIQQRKGKEFDIKEHTFHLEGFNSTSFDRSVAEEFACKKQFPGKKSVLIEYKIKIDNNRYPGFQLNRPQFTAYPEENEFLLLDGADCIIKDTREEFSNAYNTYYTVIEMEQINDWAHLNPPGAKGKKGGGGKGKKKKK